jgi:hypothetical protein
MQHGRPEFFNEKLRPCPPAAAYFKYTRAGCERHHLIKSVYFDALLNNPARVIDRQALCPVEFHQFFSAIIFSILLPLHPVHMQQQKKRGDFGIAFTR